KATRSAMPDDLVRQLPYVRRLFEALHTPVLEVRGYEADDVLATLVDKALAQPELDVVVVSGDKDLLQLVGPRVRVLSVAGRTGERVVYEEAKVRERWGVEPGQIADVLALMGDTIDNIKGVRGVGEKTAVKLIGQYGSVDRLYENLTLIPGKLRETLAAGRKDALLPRERALLNREVPVALDLDAFRRVEPDWAKLRQLWMEMEFTRLVKELPPPAPQAAPEPGQHLEGAAAITAWLGAVPAGAALAPDWARGSTPPDPRIARGAVFHPGLGAAEPPAGGARPHHPRRKAGDRVVAFPGRHPAASPRLGGRRLPPQFSAPHVQARAGLPGRAERVSPGGRCVARVRRARRVHLALLGARGRRAQDARALVDLRGDRAPARPGIGPHGAPRHPRRSRAARGVREGARARSRQPDPRDLSAGGRRVHDRLAQAARAGLVREAEAAADPEDEDWLLDGRRRADRAGARPSAPGEDPRAPEPREAQGHLRRHPARADQSRHRADPHDVQPARGGDGAAQLAGPESHEHPDPHPARAPHSPGVHSGGGPALRRGGLLADRAADSRPSVRGAGDHRIVRTRRGHSHADRLGGVQGPGGLGHVLAAHHRQERELRDPLWGVGLRPVPGDEDRSE